MYTLMQILFVIVVLGLPIVTIVALGYGIFAARSQREGTRKLFADGARTAPPVVSDVPGGA